MRIYLGTSIIPVINTLIYFVAVVESQPSILTHLTGTSALSVPDTAPRITVPPISSPTELKVKRQDARHNTCGYLDGKIEKFSGLSFTC